ncbi:MAG: hypothetical protein Q9220_005224 [cf. Caloplaca sp. 1 TL-2023]
MHILALFLSLIALTSTTQAIDPSPTPTFSIPPDAITTETVSPSGHPILSGNVYMSGTQCYIYSACGLYGISLWRSLQLALANPATTDPDNDANRIFDKYYDYAEIERDLPFDGLEADMRAHALSPLNTYHYVAILSLQSANGPPDPTDAYTIALNANDGVIVAHYSNIAADSQKRLPWSELVWRAYSGYVGLDALTEFTHLQYIIIHDIKNTGTKTLIAEIAFANDIDPAKNGGWNVWKRSDPYFISLLGTDSLQEVVKFLTGHAVELGRRQIVEVWTRGVDVRNGVGIKGVDIWVKLGDHVAGQE